MKKTRIRQLQKLVRDLQGDGYEVEPRLRSQRKALILIIKLKDVNEEEIMSPWNDLKRVEGG